MSGRLETGSTGRPAFVAWLLAAGAVLCLVALVDGIQLSWSTGSGEPGSVSRAGGSAAHRVAAVPGTVAGSDSTESGRTPIPVLVERAHVDDGCTSAGRIPIAVMVRCRHRDRTAEVARKDEGGWTDRP